MIIRTEDLKSLCSKILFAIDSSDVSILSETLELKTENEFLHMCITNREYFVDVKVNTYEDNSFNATVNAELFLKLISNASSESIELNVKDTSLEVTCDGKYSIPLVMDNDKMLEIPIMKIENITQSFNIDSSILNSIITYNSKELNKGIVTNPAQRMYYIDEHGAITFSNGACVNSFELEKPISILLPQKIVKLFKLFKDTKVAFSVGYDKIDDSDITQMKVSFEDTQIKIVAILTLGDSLTKTVPVEAIRKRAFDDYNYSVVINKNYLLSAINRLSIFSTLDKDITPFTFDFCSGYLTISNKNKTNTEDIYYSNELDIDSVYTCELYLLDLKAALEAYKDEYVTIKFGNNKAITLTHENIYNIIPECVK